MRKIGDKEEGETGVSCKINFKKLIKQDKLKNSGFNSYPLQLSLWLFSLLNVFWDWLLEDFLTRVDSGGQGGVCASLNTFVLPVSRSHSPAGCSDTVGYTIFLISMRNKTTSSYLHQRKCAVHIFWLNECMFNGELCL